MYLAKLCRGHWCSEPKFPILDWSEVEEKCICRGHPCWDDSGTTHQCNPNGEYPHLVFSYTQNRTLSCECSKHPVEATVHIRGDLCPGHSCTSPKHPILDWDDE